MVTHKKWYKSMAREYFEQINFFYDVHLPTYQRLQQKSSRWVAFGVTGWWNNEHSSQIIWKQFQTEYIFAAKPAKWALDCPSSKGKHAPHPKFERPNGKNTKSKIFLKSVQNWCLQLTWKFNEANTSKIWIKSKQIKTNENQWRFWSFYI